MESVRKVLLDSFPEFNVSLHIDGSGALAAIINKIQPDLVFLDGAKYQGSELGELGQLLRKNPNVAVIEFCEDMSASCLVNAMHAGVREVLPLPVEAKSLLEAVVRVEQRIMPVSEPLLAQGKVLAFIACKGGSGATFIATNLGYVLAAKHNVKVAFIDLNLQFGDAALFLSDQEPINSIADVTENINRLDASLFSSSMLQVLPNFGLLAAPENPEQAVSIRPEHIEVMLKIAKANYDFVILDIGRILSAVSLKALDQSDMIFPVLQETLPFIRDSKRLIHTLQSLGYTKEKIHPIVNRYDKSSEIQLRDVESALGMPVFKVIPNSYASVTTSVNQGIPIYTVDRHDPVTGALLEISHDLAAKPVDKKNGWLSRIFHAS